MRKKKILVIFGTRPEAIKLAPVVRALSRYNLIDPVVCVTGQHRELLDQVLATFGLVPNFDLGVMRPGRTLAEIAARILGGIEEVLEKVSPDFVLVHGDTTTCFAASLASFYRGIPIGHVEAGLRTWNSQAPFPEEAHRAMVGRLASLHFAPTDQAKRNLVREGTDPSRIHVTGNTVIDALNMAKRALGSASGDMFEPALRAALSDPNAPVVLVSSHRRENLGVRLEIIANAVGDLAVKHRDWRFVYLLHPNPGARSSPIAALGNLPNVFLIEPLAYVPFIWLMMRSTAILTDSGGLQEEASELGKPILIMREVTERPEALQQGTARLVGTSAETIKEAVEDAVLRPIASVKARRGLYGDGKAAQRICDALWSELNPTPANAIDRAPAAHPRPRRLRRAAARSVALELIQQLPNGQ